MFKPCYFRNFYETSVLFCNFFDNPLNQLIDELQRELYNFTCTINGAFEINIPMLNIAIAITLAIKI